MQQPGREPTPAGSAPADAAHLAAALSAVAETLWLGWHQRLPGLTVEVRPQIGSTNTELLQRARTGDGTPAVLVAVAQTAGRGRQGRRWLARPGQALTFSLGLPWCPQAGDAALLDGLSVAIGVALAEALHPRVRVKWPNDLWAFDPTGRPGKLGGVLIEVTPVAGQPAQRQVVIGVGLNVRPLDDEAPARGDETPGALAVLGEPLLQAPPGAPPAPPSMPPADLHTLSAGAASDPAAVWARVVPALIEAWLVFRRDGFAPFASRLAERDALVGREVTLWSADGRSQTGRAAGVDGGGRLLVHTAAGLLTWSAGDVSVRLAER